MDTQVLKFQTKTQIYGLKRSRTAAEAAHRHNYMDNYDTLQNNDIEALCCTFLLRDSENHLKRTKVLVGVQTGKVKFQKDACDRGLYDGIQQKTN